MTLYLIIHLLLMKRKHLLMYLERNGEKTEVTVLSLIGGQVMLYQNKIN
jgi:hypothetical protein